MSTLDRFSTFFDKGGSFCYFCLLPPTPHAPPPPPTHTPSEKVTTQNRKRILSVFRRPLFTRVRKLFDSCLRFKYTVFIVYIRTDRP